MTDVAHGGLMQRVVSAFLGGQLSLMLLLVAVASGVVAVLATPREEEPQIVVPTADVLVSFPGASAEEVEKLVATPLERLLWQIEGVDHVYSVARRDGALVTVRFRVGEDRERALVRLQSKIDAHRDEAPPGVAGWVVRPVEIDDVPIVTLTLWSSGADEASLLRVAEELAARLATVADLSGTQIIGGLRREVRVELEPDALVAFGMAPLEVTRALRAADASLLAGSFERGNRTTLVMAGPFVGDRFDAERLVVGAHAGRPVYLRDVARVIDGAGERGSYVRIRFGPAAGESDVPKDKSVAAVSIALAKKKGTNAVRVAQAVLDRAAGLRRDVLPPDMHLTVTRNYGESADQKVNELLVHLSLAIVTVVGLVALGLGWREGVIVAAAVPITFALTLLVNWLFGYSINRVTLFALVLVLGLVCDDPIVDVENIHRHFAKRELPPREAVLFAVNEVRPPVIVATLAVVLSFLPLLFITGMMGPYMRPMAINVPVAMAMSLLVAFSITPWMSYHLLLGQYGKRSEHERRSHGLLQRSYATMVRVLLARRWSRWMLFAVIGLLFLLSGFLIMRGGVPLKMLPYDNKNELQVVLDLPEGSTLEATSAAAADCEQVLATVPEVVSFTTYVGVASPIDFNGLVRRYYLRHGSTVADLRVNLVDKDDRVQQSHAISLRVRRDLERVAERHQAAMKLVEVPPGPPVLATLTAEVRGAIDQPYDEVIAGGREIARRFAAQPGVVDADVMAEEAHVRIDFVLDKEKAALHGASTFDVTRTLALALSGEDVATVHEQGERQPLVLRVVVSRAQRSGVPELGRLPIKTADGVLVPLGELGAFVPHVEEQPIYHKDLERVTFVLGEVAGRSPADAVFAMQRSVAAQPLTRGLRVDWAGEGEWKITIDVFRDLGLAFLAALVAIYVLLVIETRSFLMPLIIMLAIPLGTIGVVPGFYLLNLVAGGSVGGFADPIWFTATGMIGMIALAGIVVRNSIILIDFIRSRVAHGLSMEAAILESGAARLRPIMLTAGAAMLGAWPITLDPIFSGLAWSLIFGLIASTLFTLVVVPVVYYVTQRRAKAEAMS